MAEEKVSLKWLDRTAREVLEASLTVRMLMLEAGGDNQVREVLARLFRAMGRTLVELQGAGTEPGRKAFHDN